MKSEIYVSVDDLDYTKLDLYKDESFVMKYSKKDIQDITKVFAPFSQNFSFPATPKNKAACGFFGNTQVLKINNENKLYCKTYTGGSVNQKGILKLESVKYKNGVADSIVGSFNTTFLSLKDRIGSDNITDLSDLDNSVRWKPNTVFNRLQSISTVNSLKYYVPLYSNNRVLNYDQDEELNDNVFYRPAADPESDKVINIGELRPCVNVTSILSLIRSKYQLLITTPLESENDLKDLYMWCNGSNFAHKGVLKLATTEQYINETVYGNATNDLTDYSTNITKSSEVEQVLYYIELVNAVVGGEGETANLKLEIVKKSTLQPVLSADFEIKNGFNEMGIYIPMFLFTSNEFEFYTSMKFAKPVSWQYSNLGVRYRGDFLGDAYSYANNNINSDATGADKVDLIQALPDMSVLNFLTSYLKSFNISIYDSSPNDDNLFFLTPEDVSTPNKTYSKKEVDYTMYADKKEVVKTAVNQYNFYNLKHAKSAYRSNVDFYNQFGIEYGQTYFPLIKPDKPTEFKIETDFSILPPVLINGTQNVYTAYGFTSGAPSVSDTGLFRYEPNLDEPTMFYSHGTTVMPESLSCQNLNVTSELITSPLLVYVKTMPFCKTNGNTFSFSPIMINDVTYSNTLYSKYYSGFISRLLNPNALSQTYSLILPSSEIFLNDANVNAGTGLTPDGFRLQNDIIIGETRFEILDASVDQTTGNTKLTLLNY